MADLGRYCKKPVEIEAVRWTGVNHDDLALWGCPLWETNALAWSYTHGAYLLPDGRPIHLPEAGMHPNCLVIATPEGFMLAHPDDIIIRGVQGECCPVLDNAHGLGARGTRGADAIFWVNSDCPMHQRMTGNEEEADRD